MEVDFYFIRIFAAFLCGALLSLSGSLTQHATQNSLAGPSTLGLDGIAVICVVFAQFFIVLTPIGIGQEVLGILLFLPLIAIGFLFKNFFKKKIVSHDIKTYVLLGLCFNLFVGAIFSIIQFLFMALNFEFPTGLWFGNFRFVSFSSLSIIFFAFIVLYFLSIQIMRKLRLLSLGEGVIQNLSLDGSSVQRRALFISLVATVVVVNLFGVFSFLSLIFPLTLRRLSFFRNSLKREIIFGPLFSGVILSGIDFICYNFTFYGIEFPVGMMSSVVGAFLLMALLLSSYGKQRPL